MNWPALDALSAAVRRATRAWDDHTTAVKALGQIKDLDEQVRRGWRRRALLRRGPERVRIRCRACGDLLAVVEAVDGKLYARHSIAPDRLMPLDDVNTLAVGCLTHGAAVVDLSTVDTATRGKPVTIRTTPAG